MPSFSSGDARPEVSIGDHSQIGGDSQNSRFLFDHLALALVVLGALGMAGGIYRDLLAHHQALWGSLLHDRNAHFYSSLNFALDFRQANVGHFLKDLHQERVWPPLLPVLTGMVMALGGLDDRVAVLPNLAAYVGTVIFGFLVARRMVERGGTVAGLFSAVLIGASPAHRAFGVDIMQESLGACLTLAVLHVYLVVRQESSPRAALWFALSLTLLFFEKYNYWLLVWVPLSGVWLVSHQQEWWPRLQAAARGMKWRPWMTIQLQHPLSFLLLLIALTLAVIFIGNLQEITLAGRHISVRQPFNLVYAGYVVLLLRLWPWWWRTGREQVRRLAPLPRQIIYWHIWPVLLWLLWPQRLGSFLWYLGPGNAGEFPGQNQPSGWSFYGHAAAFDYSDAGWLSVDMAIGLMAIAALTWRRLRPGGVALLCFVLFAGLSTIYHPQRKSRFLHSWIPVGWVVAGAGFANLIYGRNRFLRQPVLAATGIAGCVLLHWPGLTEAGHAPEGGPMLDGPNTLALPGTFLPLIGPHDKVLFLSNLPVKFWAKWTILQGRGRQVGVDTDLDNLDAPRLAAPDLEAWLGQKQYDMVIFLDVSPGSALFAPLIMPGYDRVPNLMAGQDGWRPMAQRRFPQQGCSVQVWRQFSAFGIMNQEHGTPPT